MDDVFLCVLYFCYRACCEFAVAPGVRTENQGCAVAEKAGCRLHLQVEKQRHFFPCFCFYPSSLLPAPCSLLAGSSPCSPSSSPKRERAPTPRSASRPVPRSRPSLSLFLALDAALRSRFKLRTGHGTSKSRRSDSQSLSYSFIRSTVRSSVVRC